jgi:copper homeostasis protein (lipoprotein)
MDRIAPMLLAVFSLAACQPQAPSPAASPAPPPAGFDLDVERQLAWQARLPCADCDAIDTTLILQREDGAARYEIREAFIDGARGEQYAESGEWSRDGVLVRLMADDGGRRVYAIERDGRLSPRGRDGSRLERGDARFLAPVTP